MHTLLRSRKIHRHNRLTQFSQSAQLINTGSRCNETRQIILATFHRTDTIILLYGYNIQNKVFRNRILKSSQSSSFCFLASAKSLKSDHKSMTKYTF